MVYPSLVRPGTFTTCLLASLLASCGTVDLGDNFVAPDLMLDPDYFYCVVQPQVLTAQRCASGASGEMGQCHSARSSLRLSLAAETDTPPTCDGNVVTGTVPVSYEQNLEAVRFTVQSDPLSSPLYRRPIQLDSHPRKIFDAASMEARILEQWIASGAP